MKKNRYFYVCIYFLFILGCSSNVQKVDIEAKLLGKTNQLLLNLSFQMITSQKLESIIKMFNYSTINVNIRIKSNGNIIANNSIERKIKYDRWNDVFTIEDSYLNVTRKYNNFANLLDDIYIFKNIVFNVEIDKNKEYILNYDFYLKSIEFVPPFVLIQYNKEFGNIKIKNRSCKFYVN